MKEEEDDQEGYLMCNKDNDFTFTTCVVGDTSFLLTLLYFTYEAQYKATAQSLYQRLRIQNIRGHDSMFDFNPKIIISDESE